MSDFYCQLLNFFQQVNNHEQIESSESVRLNPDDQTLVDAEELPYQHILKGQNLSNVFVVFYICGNFTE
ncbi:hypothetical protein BpHYR1_015748 [Brachionus plicatilis]|uniref:Uncharacterized protein n=1 Tax=Brachionus plicatilis TaxID=10195 RepID=A0A3M7PCN5_BRAPC|nr:hypothetical protein BpHYR1_015748 [Brachionus plicatilis]